MVDGGRGDVFWGAVDPGLFLYHYTTKEAGLGNILPQRHLRLGPLSWTNDPRERQQWIVSLSGGPDPLPQPGEFQRIVYETDRLIKTRAKVVCLSRDDPDGMRKPPHENFARGWAHSRMWAQYAGGHTGLCLVFERARLGDAMDPLRAFGRVWGEPVLYANVPPSEVDAATLYDINIRRDGLEDAVKAHIAQHYRALFFVKNLDWANEWEYRWVTDSGAPAPMFVDISSALVAVIVGADFPEQEGDLLSSMTCAFPHEVQLGRCSWRNGAPFVFPGTTKIRPVAPP